MNIDNVSIKTKKGKTIIKPLNFHLDRGDLLAILGPSGSGKTTLLDFISGNIRSDLQYEGLLEIKGKVKYIAQEDNLHGFFTVRQYLRHYLELNYGTNIPSNRMEEIIIKQAEDCGLTSALDTRVGDVFFKGLSGGQKRRLSIALELVSKPDVLILDEPTSGLDSVSAYHIISVLRRLTEEGITVICTLHQPSSQIWELLNKVLLLSDGYDCYHGPPRGADHFFASIGKRVPSNYNPADYLITVINSDFDPDIDVKKIHESFIAWNRHRANHLAPQPIMARTTRKGGTSSRDLIMQVRDEATGPQKWWGLCKRGFMNLLKNPGILGVRIAMYLVLSLVIGLMYFDLGNSFGHRDIISRTSLLFYVDAFLVFMSIAAMPFFIVERGIIEKEVRNSLYKPFHYQSSMFLVSLPGIAVIAGVSSFLVMIFSQMNGFIIFFVTLLVSLVIAESLARLVSLMVPHYIIGIAAISGLYGFFMLCEGFLIVKSDIPGYFIGGYYIAFHTWSFQSFMVNEFREIESFDSRQFPDGDSVLEFYDMGDATVWKAMTILIGYAFVLELFIFIKMQHKFRERGLRNRKVLPITYPERPMIA